MTHGNSSPQCQLGRRTNDTCGAYSAQLVRTARKGKKAKNETNATRRENTRSKHERMLHTTRFNLLKSCLNRHHPSQGRWSRHLAKPTQSL